jgi:hypothetical protein
MPRGQILQRRAHTERSIGPPDLALSSPQVPQETRSQAGSGDERVARSTASCRPAPHPGATSPTPAGRGRSQGPLGIRHIQGHLLREAGRHGSRQQNERPVLFALKVAWQPAPSLAAMLEPAPDFWAARPSERPRSCRSACIAGRPSGRHRLPVGRSMILNASAVRVPSPRCHQCTVPNSPARRATADRPTAPRSSMHRYCRVSGGSKSAAGNR